MNHNIVEKDKDSSEDYNINSEHPMNNSESDNIKEPSSNEGSEDKRKPKDQIRSSEVNEEETIPKAKHQAKNGNTINVLQKIFKRADELSQKMNLDHLINGKMKELLIKVENEKKLKGRSLDYIIASVIYVACRNGGIPRPLAEIAKSLDLDKKAVSKCFNSIKNIIIDNTDNQISQNVAGLVGSYCKKMDLPVNVKDVAVEISDLICKKEVIAGRNPSTIAAVCILIASKLTEYRRLNKKDIAEKTTTTENTISNAYQELLKYKEQIIPDNLKDKKDLFS